MDDADGVNDLDGMDGADHVDGMHDGRREWHGD